MPGTEKPGEATSKKCALLANRLGAQILRLLRFAEPRTDASVLADPDKLSELIALTADSLLNNADIALDKIERFKEMKKKYNFKAQGVDRGERFPARPVKSSADNSVERPFIPRIVNKPNSRVALPESVRRAAEDPEAFFKSVPNPAAFEFPHPYELEIGELAPANLQALLPDFAAVQLSRNFGSNFAYVDTEQALYALVDELKDQRLIAIDLEYHSERSFQGFTCLMQISTPAKDYIVDPLVLRDRLQLLNLAFADPAKLKVFHGAESDVKWLQKDLGLYIVNLLDTFRIAKRVNQKSNSLASLLQSPNQPLLQRPGR